MDTRLLRSFRAIARCEGLGQAASEMHVTRSALSHGLKALESELGCRLFDRIGKRLVLNQAGEQLLSGIEGPMQAIDDVANALKQLNRWGQGRLRVGASVTACQHLLPAVFRELRRDHERLQLVVESGDMPHLLELLRDHRIDLAIGVEPDSDTHLEVHPLFQDELMFVYSSHHPWAKLDTLGKADVQAQALILYKRSSPSGQLVSRFLQDHRMEPFTTMEVASVTAIKEMVLLNLGVAVLAPWVVEKELTRGILQMRPIGTRPLRRRWVITHLAAKRLNLAETRFCRLCRNQATALRKDRRELPGTPSLE